MIKSNIKNSALKGSSEIGRSGINFSQGYGYEEFLVNLQGLSGIKIYREMSDNDPIIGACLYAIKQIIKEARWSVKPYDESDEKCKKDAEFLNSCRGSLTHSWSDFISNVLTMLSYGWSWFEQVYYLDEMRRVRWRKFAPRVQSSLDRWDIDDKDALISFIQRPIPDYIERSIPLSKSLHFKTEDASGNPEGRSILRNAYRPWYFKKNLEEIEAIGIERDLVGMPQLKAPEGINLASPNEEEVTLINDAKKLLRTIRRDEQDGILIPFGWEFNLISSPGSKQFDTTSIINRYNKEMSVTTLAQFIMLGMERTGSYALASEQTDMFHLCLEGWTDGIASTFNRQAVPPLFQLNGDHSGRYPFVVHTPIKRYDLKTLSSYVATLVKVNAIEIDNELKGYLRRFAKLDEYSDVKK